MSIIFRNLNESPMTAFVPKWQEDIMERVNREYQEKALEAEKDFLKIYNEQLSSVKEGYAASYMVACMRETPRFEYIKNITDKWGDKYEAEIDLLLHTVEFILIDEKD